MKRSRDLVDLLVGITAAAIVVWAGSHVVASTSLVFPIGGLFWSVIGGLLGLGGGYAAARLFRRKFRARVSLAYDVKDDELVRSLSSYLQDNEYRVLLVRADGADLLLTDEQLEKSIKKTDLWISILTDHVVTGSLQTAIDFVHSQHKDLLVLSQQGIPLPGSVERSEVMRLPRKRTRGNIERFQRAVDQRISSIIVAGRSGIQNTLMASRVP
jgi:hypothetical protein